MADDKTVPLKVIIAGSRSIKWYSLVSKVIQESCWIDFLLQLDPNTGESIPVPGSEVVCGMAQGVDQLGHIWATKHGIKVKQFPANWERYGRRAGIVRNREMAKYADVLIAIWDNKSTGTKHMITEMMERGKGVYVYIVSEREMLAYESIRNVHDMTIGNMPDIT